METPKDEIDNIIHSFNSTLTNDYYNNTTIVNFLDKNYNCIGSYSDFVHSNIDVPKFIEVMFQERIKDLYVFCIHKNYRNQYNIALFEIEGGRITDNLNKIIKILKKDLSLEEFREYERQIFKYF